MEKNMKHYNIEKDMRYLQYFCRRNIIILQTNYI